MGVRIPKMELGLLLVLAFFYCHRFVHFHPKVRLWDRSNNNCDSNQASREGKGRVGKPIGRIRMLRFARRHWLQKKIKFVGKNI